MGGPKIGIAEDFVFRIAGRRPGGEAVMSRTVRGLGARAGKFKEFLFEQ